MIWKEKANLILDWVEKGGKDIEHLGVNHHRLLHFLIPTGRKQRHATDAIQRHQRPPTRIRSSDHLNAGESYIHDSANTLHHKTAEVSGGGVNLSAQPPRLRQERRGSQERSQHLAALKPDRKKRDEFQQL